MGGKSGFTKTKGLESFGRISACSDQTDDHFTIGMSWWRQWGTINENGIVKSSQWFATTLGSLCKWTNWHVSVPPRRASGSGAWHYRLPDGVAEVRSCGLILTGMGRRFLRICNAVRYRRVGWPSNRVATVYYNSTGSMTIVITGFL